MLIMIAQCLQCLTYYIYMDAIKCLDDSKLKNKFPVL